MAVESKFANTKVGTGTLIDAAKGGNIKYMQESLAVAAADDDGSIYGLFIVNSGDVPVRCDIQTTAITSGTDYDLGLYAYNNDGIIGAVVDKDILMDGQTMATASVALNGLSAVAAASRGKTYWELAGLTKDPQKQYVVALTANTVGSAAGTIHVDLINCTAG